MGDTRKGHKVWVVKDRWGRQVETITRGSQLSSARKRAKELGGTVDLFDHTIGIAAHDAGPGETVTVRYKPYSVPVSVASTSLQSGGISYVSGAMVRAGNDMLKELNSQMFGSVRISPIDPRR